MNLRKGSRRGSAAHNEQQSRFDDEASLLDAIEQTNTKTSQLCAQVEEAIAYALVCSANPLLRDLHVTSVRPLRGSGLLEVVFGSTGPVFDYEGTRRALDRANGYFRSEVAHAINRRRVPRLSFALIPANGVLADQGYD